MNSGGYLPLAAKVLISTTFTDTEVNSYYCFSIITTQVEKIAPKTEN